ncbi:MAG: hypothetical protein O2983_13075, partial [Planctomycetota bacterium]|nr:hypothetical protein [Planctomycetota bacterium]
MSFLQAAGAAMVCFLRVVGQESGVFVKVTFVLSGIDRIERCRCLVFLVGGEWLLTGLLVFR